MTGKEFWDGIAERYAARPVSDEAAYQASLDRVRHYLRAGMDVLELGCGTGATALALTDTGARITGTDLSPAMIAIAQRRADEAATDALQFDVMALQDSTGPRDAVLAFNLLHLMPDLPGALGHIRGLLPAGGLFLSKTPCLAGKLWLRPVLWAMQVLRKAPPDVSFLQTTALEDRIRAAGFEILETGGYPARLPHHFVAARAI